MTNFLTVFMTILFFVIIFSIIVISHEFGHFLLAKANGIRVIEFAVGMGPTLLAFHKGETKYSLKLLPFGGACMFDGEDGLGLEEGATPEPGSFLAANVWSRISCVIAGPLFNFILAFLFSMIVVGFCGTDLPILEEIATGQAAEEAGLKTGDIIKEIDGENIHLYRELSLISMLNRGENMEIVYERDGKEYETTVQPRYDEVAGRYYMGITGRGTYLECRGVKLLQYSAYEVQYWMRATIKSLGMILQGNVTKDDVSGPVGIAQVVGQTYVETKDYGISTVLFSMMNIAILLSVNLGVLNLLPLPALDGGRLVFMLIEVIRGKPVPPEKEGMVHFIGLVVFMILMVLVMYNDIMRLFGR